MSRLTIELSDKLKSELIIYSIKINQDLKFTIRYLLACALLEKEECSASRLSREDRQREISKYLTPEKTAEFLKLLDKV